MEAENWRAVGIGCAPFRHFDFRDWVQMSKHSDRIELPAVSPGTSRHLLVHTYRGDGGGPKAYLQAAIHADEIPGMLVLHHLQRQLDEADASGLIRGQVVLVPAANPVGLGQQLLGYLVGRYDFMGGGNFNRGWPDLSSEVAERVASRLGAGAAANVSIIRAAAVAVLDERVAETENESLRLALWRLAVDADLVFDLHCDYEAVLHLYTHDDCWDQAEELHCQLGSRVSLLARRSGGEPFDEAFSGLWQGLRDRFPEHPIPFACMSTTIELRGLADVDDRTASRDADNLFRYLQRRGVISGDPGPLPQPLSSATPLAGLDYISAPCAGIIVYRKSPGDAVSKGEIIAEIVDPIAQLPAPGRVVVKSTVDGVMMSRQRIRLAQPGQKIASLAGAQELAHRQGHLLSD